MILSELFQSFPQFHAREAVLAETVVVSLPEKSGISVCIQALFIQQNIQSVVREIINRIFHPVVYFIIFMTVIVRHIISCDKRVRVYIKQPKYVGL